MMSQMKAAAARNYTLNGVPTSLADLGFSDIGLDDNWFVKWRRKAMGTGSSRRKAHIYAFLRAFCLATLPTERPRFCAPVPILELSANNRQNCSHRGPNNYTYHDPNTGAPLVRLDTFPDMKAMTDYAHSLGLTAGWYGNNCICSDHCDTPECYAADVAATVAYGFDSTKLDGRSFGAG